MESAVKSCNIGHVPDKDHEMATYRFVLMDRDSTEPGGAPTTEVVL